MPFGGVCTARNLQIHCIYPLTSDQMVTYNSDMEVEHVFHALADHHRRHLLDLLSQNEGQTLTQLSAHLPMSRFGAMKHLRVLEDAGLVNSRKVGREKLHYLNPVPLQEVAGWLDQYRRFWDERLDRLEEYLLEVQKEHKEQRNEPDKP
jgi:predicted transcriptional regulator